MSTPKYNLALNRGETFQKNIQLIEVGGLPMDLTGYTVAADIKASYLDTASAASFGCNVTGPTTGEFQIQLSASSSLNLTGSCYLYDVRITSGSIARYVLEGKVHISPSVTL